MRAEQDIQACYDETGHLLLQYQTQAGSLKVIMRAEPTLPRTQQMMQAFYQVLDKLDPDRVWVDNRPLAGRLSLSDSYVLLHSLPLPRRRRRMAVVEDPVWAEHVRFMETAVRNAGGMLRYFYEEDEAWQWLLSE